MRNATEQHCRPDCIEQPRGWPRTNPIYTAARRLSHRHSINEARRGRTPHIFRGGRSGNWHIGHRGRVISCSAVDQESRYRREYRAGWCLRAHVATCTQAACPARARSIHDAYGIPEYRMPTRGLLWGRLSRRNPLPGVTDPGRLAEDYRGRCRRRREECDRGRADRRRDGRTPRPAVRGWTYHQS